MNELNTVLQDLGHIEEFLPHSEKTEYVEDLIQNIRDLQQYLEASLHDLNRCIMQDSDYNFDDLYNSAMGNLSSADGELTMINNFVIDDELVKGLRDQYRNEMLLADPA